MELAAFWDLILTGLLRGGFYALMALGLALVLGVMNVSHFAHGEFYMVGAYAAYFAHTAFGLNPLLAILMAGLIGFAIGALVEKVVIYSLRKRTKEDWVMNTFLLTVGISFVFINSAKLIWGARFRGVAHYWEGTIYLSEGLRISIDRGAGFLIAIAAIALTWFFLNRTQLGRAIRAVAQDEIGAMLVGINLDRMNTLTFALSSLLAGIAGGSLLSINAAYPYMGLRPSNRSWYVVMLVGLGNVGGAIIGGFIVGIVETLSYYFLGAGWQDVASLLILVLILLFKPSGIFGTEVKGVLER